MVLLTNHVHSVRRQLLIGPSVLALSIWFNGLSVSSPAGSFEHLLAWIQHDIFNGLIYTPIFLLLTAPLLKYVGRPQLILRIGGVGCSFRQVLGISLFFATLYSAVLLMIMLIVVICSGAPPPHGGMLIAFLFAEYFGYVFYFFGCSVLMLIVYMLSRHKTSISVIFILGYGLLDCFGRIPALPFGWVHIRDITSGLFSRTIASGMIDVAGATAHLLCFCLMGYLILYFIGNNFDYLDAQKSDYRST